MHVASPAALVLASGSPGRLRLLRAAGIDPEVVVSGADETIDDGLDTVAAVAALAERKAAAVATLMAQARPDALVLGCDSMLDFDGRALGKPASAPAAAGLWRRLSGRAGTLCTGHCLIAAGGRRISAVARTVVRFGAPTEAEIAAYVASGEPMAVAGGFCIDGLGAPFVEGVDGDPGNVIGLSLPLLRHMLADLGLAITDLWRVRAG
jgi:nucleoside triphosphate pyrophosphatase